jgi:hypothetical protein
MESMALLTLAPRSSLEQPVGVRGCVAWKGREAVNGYMVSSSG